MNTNIMTNIARLFSTIMEEEVSEKFAFHLIHAQVSFAALVLLGSINLWVACGMLAWFLLSVYCCMQAKKGETKELLDNRESDITFRAPAHAA